MKTATLKDAFKASIVNSISPIRANENDYLFVTVLNRNGSSSNVYFGKKSAEQVEEGDTLTKEQMLNAEFVLATNDVGEGRIKLSLAGASDYVNLGSIFDDVEVTADHSAEVLKALKADMTTKEQDEAGAETDDDDDDEAEEIARALAIKEARKAKKLADKKLATK